MKLLRNDALKALFILIVVLNIFFFPVIWCGKTLLTSVRDVPSILPTGAYGENIPPKRFLWTADPGASAWHADPLFKIISHQYFQEKNLPLWDPYEAYGMPLAAGMQAAAFNPSNLLFFPFPNIASRDLFLIFRFLTAGVFMFLFAKLFLPFLPSLFSSIAFMFSGYFIVFLPVDHLSVEVLLPSVFWAFELLLRNKGKKNIVLASLMIWQVIVAGMPESTFLILVYGCLYALFRILTDSELRANWSVPIMEIVAAYAMGFCLAAFLLLPFVEFMRLSSDTHQPGNVRDIVGLLHEGDLRMTLTYLVPLAFGPIYNCILTGLTGFTGLVAYWGGVVFLFALMAVLASMSFWERTRNPLRIIVCFFGLSIILMLMKRFGSPLVNWIGGVPVANMVTFTKYQEPLMGFSMAFLAGTGLFAWMEHREERWLGVTTGVICLAVLMGLALSWLPQIHVLPAWSLVFYGSVLVTAVSLAAVTLFLFLFRKEKHSWAPLLLLVFLCAELFLNYIFPCLYSVNKIPPARYSPYQGASYVDFLETKTSDGSRVFGREGVLFPNWAGTFGLYDVRSLTAMMYRPYREFIRNFLLAPGDEARVHEDLADRFTGYDKMYDYSFKTPLEKRFLELSSIKYLLSISSYGSRGDVSEAILAGQDRADESGFTKKTIKVNGGFETVLCQYPPSSRLPYTTVIDRRTPFLHLGIILEPNVYSVTSGARFILEVRDGKNIEKVFERILDPKNNSQDRGWQELNLDLRRFSGKRIDLLFSTGPGVSNLISASRAGWGKLSFVDDQGVQHQRRKQDPFFKKIYDNEVKIYEISDPLPRAAIFNSIEVVGSEREVLSRLKDGRFDPWRYVVLSKEQADKVEQLKTLSRGLASKAVPASILSYSSQRVKIEAETKKPGILMLTDSNYPGWKVYVDGKASSLLGVNYLFRGVFLDPGRHIVEFVYKPFLFMLGLIITCIAFLGIVIMTVLKN